MRGALKPFAQRLEQLEGDRQLVHRGRLAAGDDERVDVVQLTWPTDGDAHRPGPGQRAQVFAHVALKSEDADARRAHQPRVASRWSTGTSSTLMPTIASPNPRDTLATTSGSS